MKSILLLLAIFLTYACGRDVDRHEAVDTHNETALLTTQYSLYHSLAPRGWEAYTGCDALLFVSLHQVGLGEAGPVVEAQSEPGRWFRLPGPAYASECSSDISRDMLTGLFIWIWRNQRLDLAEALWEYGESHDWKMGEERKNFENRVVLTPSMIRILADLVFYLGGKDHPERHIPIVYSTAPGFTSHLSLLQIYLEGRMVGGLSESTLQALYEIRAHMGQNPLVHALIHRYTDGDQTEATNLLLSIWPQNRLPDHGDWTEDWRLQRSDGDTGLNPGGEPGGRAHAGGDFLFVASIILGWN